MPVNTNLPTITEIARWLGPRLEKALRIKSEKWRSVAKFSPFVPLVPIVGILILIAWHSRIAADDWWFLAATTEHGFPETIFFWYKTWTGRYSYAAAQTVASLLGPCYPQVALVGWFIVWFAVAVFLFRAIKCSWAVSLSAGLCIVVLPCLMSDALGESIFWESACGTYVGSIVWMMICALGIILLSKRMTWWAFVALMLLAFVSCGFNEVATAYIDIGLTIALALTRSRNTLGALVGAIIGTVLMLSSPGNHIRDVADQTVHHTLAWCTHKSYRQASMMAFGCISLPLDVDWPDIFDPPSFGANSAGCITSIAFYIGMLIPGKLNWKKSVIGIVLLPPLSFGAIWLACFIGTYALGTRLPDRSMTMPYFMILAGLAGCGYCVKCILTSLPKVWQFLRSYWVLPAMLLWITVSLMLATIPTLMNDYSQSMAFSKVMDKGICEAQSNAAMVVIPYGAYAWWTPSYLPYYACHNAQQIKTLRLSKRKFAFIGGQ